MTYLLIISILLNVAFGTVLVVLAKRLLGHDLYLELIDDDIDELVEVLEEMLSRPTLSNSPEIKMVHKNMETLKERLKMHSVNLKLSTRDTIEQELEA